MFDLAKKTTLALALGALPAITLAEAKWQNSLTAEATTFFHESPVADYDASASATFSSAVSGVIYEGEAASLSAAADVDLSVGSTTSTDTATINRAVMTYTQGNATVIAGTDIVTWGVVEGQSVVDIINQRDYSASIDQDKKITQPLVRGAYTAGDWTLEGYGLIGNAPKLFSESDERFHGFFAIEEDEEYAAGASSSEIDIALRAYTFFDGGDIAFSYFNGVSRDPFFVTRTGPLTAPPATVSDIGVLPVYVNLEQVGVEFQYFLPYDTTAKFEYAYREMSGDAVFNQIESDTESSYGYVVGLEHNAPGLFGDGIDGTLIAEYGFDSRADATPATQFNHDLLLALRVKQYSALSPEFTLGWVTDTQDADNVVYAEASFKATPTIKVFVKGMGFRSADGRPDSEQLSSRDYRDYFAHNGQSTIFPVTPDSYLTIGFTKYF